MTSWPWMKGVTTAVADPVPVSDGRPSIKDLITEHRERIDQLKQNLVNDAPEFDESKHDDLWLLRFILSHKKKIPAATKAAKYTLKFRKEHKLDDVDLRFHPPGPTAQCDGLLRYAEYTDKEDTFQWTLPDDSKGPVTFIRYAGLDQHQLVKHVAEEDWLASFLYCSEWSHQWADRTSRVTGRLTKNVRLVDLNGMKVLDFSMTNSKRDGKVMNLMEDCYPQLLQAVYVVNPPIWISTIWDLCRPLMPKRVVAKFDIIRPAKKDKDRELLLQFIDESNLPTKFGGTYEKWPVDYPLAR